MKRFNVVIAHPYTLGFIGTARKVFRYDPNSDVDRVHNAIQGWFSKFKSVDYVDGYAPSDKRPFHWEDLMQNGLLEPVYTEVWEMQTSDSETKFVKLGGIHPNENEYSGYIYPQGLRLPRLRWDTTQPGEKKK